MNTKHEELAKDLNIVTTHDLKSRDTCIRLALSLILYTMYTGKAYNIYRFQGKPGYETLRSALHDVAFVMSYELMMNALESYGFVINDSPGYKDTNHFDKWSRW